MESVKRRMVMIFAAAAPDSRKMEHSKSTQRPTLMSAAASTTGNANERTNGIGQCSGETYTESDTDSLGSNIDGVGMLHQRRRVAHTVTTSSDDDVDGDDNDDRGGVQPNGNDLGRNAKYDDDGQSMSGDDRIHDEDDDDDSDIVSFDGDSDEVPVWVRNERRWISGLTADTTCGQLVEALLRDDGLLNERSPASQIASQLGQYVISEKWRSVEQILAADTKVLNIWTAWGEAQSQVRLLLRKIQSPSTFSWRDCGGVAVATSTTPPTVDIDSGRESPAFDNRIASQDQAHADVNATNRDTTAQPTTSRHNTGNIDGTTVPSLRRRGGGRNHRHQHEKQRPSASGGSTAPNQQRHRSAQHQPINTQSRTHQQHHHHHYRHQGQQRAQRSAADAKTIAVHPKTQRPNSIEKLMKLILEQGETIQQQLIKLRDREQQIRRIEEARQRREKEHGRNYVLKAYLNSLNVATGGVVNDSDVANGVDGVADGGDIDVGGNGIRGGGIDVGGCQNSDSGMHEGGSSPDGGGRSSSIGTATSIVPHDGHPAKHHRFNTDQVDNFPLDMEAHARVSNSKKPPVFPLGKRKPKSKREFELFRHHQNNREQILHSASDVPSNGNSEAAGNRCGLDDQIEWLEKIIVINKQLQREEELIIRLNAKLSKCKSSDPNMSMVQLNAAIGTLDSSLEFSIGETERTQREIDITQAMISSKEDLVAGLTSELLRMEETEAELRKLEPNICSSQSVGVDEYSAEPNGTNDDVGLHPFGEIGLTAAFMQMGTLV